MSLGIQVLDGRWKSFSASLRDGVIYLKMPREHARKICAHWLLISHEHPEVEAGLLPGLFATIQAEEAQDELAIRSCFLSIPADEAQVTIDHLDRFAQWDDPGGFMNKFRGSLRLGLLGDPDVDWIVRVGGPLKFGSQDQPVASEEDLFFEAADLHQIENLLGGIENETGNGNTQGSAGWIEGLEGAIEDITTEIVDELEEDIEEVAEVLANAIVSEISGSNKTRKGFTLIEALFVVAIIGLCCYGFLDALKTSSFCN